MPGTFVFKPIEANLTHNTDVITKMNPYCTFVVGNNRIKGQVSKKGGKHPHWNDIITIPATKESKVLVELMDKDKITHDDVIGSCVLDLNEIQTTGQVSKWYSLYYKNKPAGEILMESLFQPDASSSFDSHSYAYQQEQHHHHQHMAGGMTQTGFIQNEEEIIANATQPTTFIQEQQYQQVPSTGTHVFQEQRQVVEPHTFMKEVDAVEMRSQLKEIEVMEPVKVVKDVQYTEAVPVKKQIEVVEPQVVTKEVEVIEPQLVTKTIQVVENVPVKKQVEVVELRNAVQEVETVEPQTFTKQVEVTEFMPVKKEVEVTQPVTVKKAVEFVEPVITTQTITKEIQQPVIVDEKVTTTVGPTTVVGMSSEYREVASTAGYVEKRLIDDIRISEQERVIEESQIGAAHHHHHHDNHHHHHHHKGAYSSMDNKF